MGFRERYASVVIYIFPCLMDLLLGLYRFVNMMRVARHGGSATEVGGVLVVSGLCYLVASQLVGKFVTPLNSARIMIASCVLSATLCVLFLQVDSTLGMYVLMGLVSFAVAMFFVPFQIFMKAVDGKKNKTIARSTGMYTFSWSTGIAIGPFISGFLMDLGGKAGGEVETTGWRYCYLVAMALSVLLGAAIFAFRKNAHPHESALAAPSTPPARQKPPAHDERRRLPDLAWLSWVCGGIGIIVLVLVQNVFTKQAEVSGISSGATGTVFFLISFAQGLFALTLCRSRTWMFEGWKVVSFGGAGLAGLLLFALGGSIFTYCLAACLLGIYGSTMFFYFVYHAIIHPSRSARYVSINESVVGLAGVVGPLLGGMLADAHGFEFSYLAGAAILAATLLFQLGAHLKLVRNLPDIERITSGRF